MGIPAKPSIGHSDIEQDDRPRGAKPGFSVVDLSRHVYLKPVRIEGRPACTVHDADGVCLWFEDDLESAREDLRNNDVVELTIH